MTEIIYRIALDTPLRNLFDYLPSTKEQIINIGSRVTVPFGKRKEVIGIVLETSKHSELGIDKLKRVTNIIDNQPILDSNLLKLINWSSRYYHHPIGEVVFSALPVWFRQGKPLDKLYDKYWAITDAGLNIDCNDLIRSPKQAQLLNFFQQHKHLQENDLLSKFPWCKTVLKKLVDKKWIMSGNPKENINTLHIANRTNEPNKHQREAIELIISQLDQHHIYLLDGLTGSGKTEVYLTIMEETLKKGKQCLILLPEIGLTPQVVQRFNKRFKCHIVVQHSGLSDKERGRAWLDAASGKAQVILGTRSAVWMPLKNPGLFIIDEEHDLSYKQQDGLRYSARDVLVRRAQQEALSVILGTATPSCESLNNVQLKRYQHLILPERAGESTMPTYHLSDIKGKKMHGAISQALIDEMTLHLENNKQVLLFLNRRGYANQLFCHACGMVAQCERCETPYTFHKSRNKLICHHCDGQRPRPINCNHCHEELLLIGHGTERIEETLKTHFPEKKIVRIDRDTTRRKDAFQHYLNDIQSGQSQILLGTQMLAKGHHFPNVTLTAIIDTDRCLFSTDFRASERLAQLFIQVSGRAGRGKHPGKVFVQTHYPKHELFQTLIHKGYRAYAEKLLAERKLAGLPPYQYMALLRAEDNQSEQCRLFLLKARELFMQLNQKNLSCFGPLPSMIEKRSGRYRWQLIIESGSRNSLHKHLNEWLMQLNMIKLSKKVRWSLDIDPQDMA